MTDDLITRTTEEFRELRKKLTQALRLVERLIEDSVLRFSTKSIWRARKFVRCSASVNVPCKFIGTNASFPMRCSAESFSILSQQSSRYWSVISEKPCDEIYIGSPENDYFSGLCIFLASYTIKLLEWTIHVRSFVVPKSIRIGCLYNGRLYFHPTDFRMACSANRIPDSVIIGCSYSRYCHMISKQQTLISSSVKTFPFMMRWMRRQRSYSCRNRQIFSICRFR